jgi:hypothetical protein
MNLLNTLFTETYIVLTIFIYILSFAVVFHYRKGLRPRKQWREWRTSDWLILGIVLAFSGKILDAIYWHIAWQVFLLDSQKAEFLFKWGTTANIPLRQLPIIAAALCHLRAAYVADNKKWNWIPVRAIFVGILVFYICSIIAQLIIS